MKTVTKTLKLSDKDGELLYNKYSRATKTNLFQHYKKPSRQKLIAWQDIENESRTLKGGATWLCGANIRGFEAAFIYVDGEMNDILRYYTPDNVYEVIL